MKERFAAKDRIRFRDPRFAFFFRVPPGSYVVVRVVEVGSIKSAEDARKVGLSGYEVALVSGGAKPKELYGHSQLLVLKHKNRILRSIFNRPRMFVGKDFTKKS